MRGLNFQPMHIPLAAGLNQKADTRALQAPSLLLANDVQFDDAGGLQLRYPFESLGSFDSSVRAVVANGDELLCFTADTLYSYDEGQGVWRNRGTHLAIKVEETPRFVTPGDQINCDRAELGDTIAFCWEDTGTTYYATIDRLTGALTTAPTAIASTIRPKLVALDTKFLLFGLNQPGGLANIEVRSLDPSTLTLSSATFIAASCSLYDVVKVPGADQAVFAIGRLITTSYLVGTVTAGLVLATSSKARTSNGPIAVSCNLDGQVQIVRANAGAVIGDAVFVTGFSDDFINQAIGNTTSGSPAQITCAHRSVLDGGEYRCYVFWSDQEYTDGTDFSSYSNWVDSAGTLGTAARFVRQLGLASRAFDHNGSVYLWTVFGGASQTLSPAGDPPAGGQLQNTYFLYRDDGFLCAKAAAGRAGGYISTTNTGLLPGVTLRVGSTTSYAFAGMERRIVPIGVDLYSYSDRGPRDFTFTFDSNEARRCARLGSTLYVSGGEILQYDGVRLTEVGFHVYPWIFVLAGMGGTGLAIGEYFYRSTLRWENAQGEIDRSTTATTATATLAGASDVSLVQLPLYVSHKTANAPAIEWWRTPVDPDGDADFLLVTNRDPAQTANPNRYLANDTTVSQTATVEDSFSDTELQEGERYPEAAGEMENLCPPPATILATSADRLFLAGVAGDPDRVWYSKQRAPNRVVSFNDVLTCDVPHQGGAITALAFLNETLVVFRERAIYTLPGDGLDNLGDGQNYGPARSISLDVGATKQEAVAVTPDGIIFKSSKGWHLLDRGWSVKYIGGPVKDYDADDVMGVSVLEERHQIRICTGDGDGRRLLVLDTLAGQWAAWMDGAVPNGSTMWRGRHVIADATSVRAELSTLTGIDYGIDVETAWIKPAELQGFVRVTKILLLGEYRSECAVRIRIAYDYVDTYVDDETWAASPTTAGGPMQVKYGPSRQQCQALKIRITAVAAVDDTSPPAGEGFALTGLALEVGLQGGLYRRLPAAQRQ